MDPQEGPLHTGIQALLRMTGDPDPTGNLLVPFGSAPYTRFAPELLNALELAYY